MSQDLVLRPQLPREDPVDLLHELGLPDLLEHDPRPTFVLNSTDAQNSGSGFDPVFRNTALTIADSGALWDAIREYKDADRINRKDVGPYPQFRQWIFHQNSKPSETFFFCDYNWRKCTIANHWIVLSGSSAKALSSREESRVDEEPLSVKSSRSNLTTFDWTDDPPPVKLSAHVAWARSIDWANTPLGPMRGWSPQLRSNASLIMQDPRPAVGFYGPELIMIYNEAYIELLGGLHPCMGRSAREVLTSVWNTYFEPIIEKNLEGETVDNFNTEIPLIRNGFVEETYFSTRFIPIFNSEGATIGHYEPVVETVSINQRVSFEQHRRTKHNMLLTNAFYIWSNACCLIQLTAITP
jgi:hypothetical protein